MNFLKHLGGIYNTTYRANFTHKIVLQTIIGGLSLIENDLELMILELCINTATGKWLDEWGNWFGVYRKFEEKDREYSVRIIATIQTPKSTIPSIKQNTANYLNSLIGQDKYTKDDIDVFEPFEYVMVYSNKRSEYSSKQKFQDKFYWRHNVIDIKLPENPTDDLKEFLQKIKAAGIKIVYTISPDAIIVDMTNISLNKVYIDKYMVIELICNYMLEANIFDVRNQCIKYLSGKKILYGIYRDIDIILNKVNAYRKLSLSYFYSEKDCIFPIIREGQQGEPQILSKQLGNLSGVLLPYYEYINKVPDDDRWDLQYGFERYRTKLIPIILSEWKIELSEGYTFSGTINEEFIKPQIKQTNIDMFTSNSHSIAEKGFTTYVHIPFKNYDDFLSGHRLLWIGYTDIEIVLNKVTFKRQVLLTQYLNLDDIAKIRLSNNKIKFNSFADLEFTDYIPPVQIHSTKLIPIIFSKRYSYSERYPLSGCIGETEIIEKPIETTINMFAKYETKPQTIKIEKALYINPNLEIGFSTKKSDILSGKRILWHKLDTDIILNKVGFNLNNNISPVQIYSTELVPIMLSKRYFYSEKYPLSGCIGETEIIEKSVKTKIDIVAKYDYNDLNILIEKSVHIEIKSNTGLSTEISNLLSGKRGLWDNSDIDIILQKTDFKRRVFLTPYLNLEEVAINYLPNGTTEINTIEDTKYNEYITAVQTNKNELE